MEKKLIFLFILFLIVKVNTAPTKVVLQNGTHGYSGCRDSYNFNITLDMNYGEDLMLYNVNCQK